MKKITIYALHLGVGGVEKYISTLANMLIEICEVRIVVTYKILPKPAFFIDPRVEIEYLISDKKPNRDRIKVAIANRNLISIIKEGVFSLKILYQKVARNKKSIRQCDSDIIISTRIFHNKLISKNAAKQIIKITGEHNFHNYNDKYIAKVIKSCKGFDYFIPISKYLSDYYRPFLEKYKVKTKYIRFCVDDKANNQISLLNNSNLISVGRLSTEKGYKDLIEVFAIIHRMNNTAILNIIGDGEELEDLKNLVKEKELTNYVVFHGFQNKEYIYSQMYNSSIYLMTSYTESFGIVLLEAMSCGIPCVAFSSAKGAEEIITDHENGLIIEKRDINSMAMEVTKLLNNRTLLKQLSRNAINTASLYSYSATKHEWQKFILSLETRVRK